MGWDSKSGDGTVGMAEAVRTLVVGRRDSPEKMSVGRRWELSWCW